MKYFLSSVSVLPLLVSCTMVQQEYYDQDYYAPGPRAEVHRYYPRSNYFNEHVHRPRYRDGSNEHRHVEEDRIVHRHEAQEAPRSAQAENRIVHGHPGEENPSGPIHQHD